MSDSIDRADSRQRNRAVIEGAVGSLTRWGAAGWVWAPSAPDKALEVEAVLDGKVIAQTTANLPRADLRDTGKGTGQYGFAMTFADEVGSDRAPVIRVTGPEGLVDLSDGKWPPVIGFVDIVTRSGADGWAWLPTLGEGAAEVEAFLDNKSIGHATADQIRSDLVAVGMGSGRFGFMLIFDQPVVGDKVPEFRVSTQGKKVSLPSRKEFAADALPEVRPAAPGEEGEKSPKIAAAAGDSVINKGVVSPANDKTAARNVIEITSRVEGQRADDKDDPLSTANQGKKIKNFIDLKTADRVAGWIAADESRPATVVVEINGEFAFELVANEKRQDVKDARFSASEYCGFSFTVSPVWHNFMPCRVSVYEKNSKQPLNGSPFELNVRPGKQATTPRISVPDLNEYITSTLSQINSSDELGKLVPLFLNWASFALGRAAALDKVKQKSYREIGTWVEANGGLQGVIGHFWGVVQQKYPVMRVQTSESPRVSVIIPVYNQFALTYACIRSIEEHLPETPFEIIIADDVSTDETVLTNLVIQGVNYVRGGDNLGFVGNCNRGASQARGEFLFFLNNDTLVEDGWLDELVKTMDRDPSIGIAGSRLTFDDGILQEAGGIIWRDASGWNWGRRQQKDHPKFSFMRDADYVSGAALMIRREDFQKFGGFDQLYKPAYYEDTDLCFKMRQDGRRVVVQPSSTIVHLEGRSNGVDTSSGLKRYQVINHKKFARRWAETLKTHRPNGEFPDLEAERNVKRRVLVIDDTTPTPDRDAGSNAIMTHMLSLQRLGYKVIFLPADNMANIPNYTRALQSLGIEAWYAPYAWSIEDYFRRNKAPVDLIYIHRRNNAARYMELCRKYAPDAPVVFNVADIHSLRELREGTLNGQATVGQARTQEAVDREIDLMAAADATIVHSSYELEFVRKRRPKVNIHVVPWAVPLAETIPPFGERRGTAFVGGFSHTPNVDAVDWFLERVWPLVTARNAKLTLEIIGSQMPERFEAYRSELVRPVGYVADLETSLAQKLFTVAPLRYGAGVKGKVLSSFACGTPCIMSEIAAEGIPLTPQLEMLVAKTPADYGDIALRLASDENFWRQMSSGARELIARTNSVQSVEGALKACIDSLLVAKAHLAAERAAEDRTTPLHARLN